MVPPVIEPDAFPYYACATCPWFHKKGKPCSGCPKKPRLAYDTLCISRLLVHRAVRDARATCETLDPEVREGLLGMWAEGRRELVCWMEGGVRGEGAEEGGRRGEGAADRGGSIEEEETLGDKEWEAKFAEVGEMVEMYLRMGAAEGGMAPRKGLVERAIEEKGMGGVLEEKGMSGLVEKKQMGRMQARDERDAGWRARYRELRAMVELEEEVERGVWRR